VPSAVLDAVEARTDPVVVDGVRGADLSATRLVVR
jgi:hypothetical protein